MKVATIVHDAPIRMPREALFDAWVERVLSVFDVSDVVLMVERGGRYGHMWPCTVELEPFEGFVPLYSLQHLVFSDYYKAQGFHLLREPVLILDLDCFVQADLPRWSDSVYRLGQHNPGTAPENDSVNGEKVKHLNCAVQYQGTDIFARFKECVSTVISDKEQRASWMLGELAFSLMFRMMQAEGSAVEMLPLEYSWYAEIEPYPESARILHYGREARELLLRKMEMSPHALAEGANRFRSRASPGDICGSCSGL